MINMATAHQVDVSQLRLQAERTRQELLNLEALINQHDPPLQNTTANVIASSPGNYLVDSNHHGASGTDGPYHSSHLRQHRQQEQQHRQHQQRQQRQHHPQQHQHRQQPTRTAPAMGRKANMQRSKSTMGHSLSPSTSTAMDWNTEPRQPVELTRAMSQQHPSSSRPSLSMPAARMARNHSSRSVGPSPFVITGHIGSLQEASQPSSPVMDRFNSSEDSSPYAHMAASSLPHHPFQQQLQVQSQQHGSGGLAPVEENTQYPDVGMNPLEYLAANGDDLPSPGPMPPVRQNLAGYGSTSPSSSQMSSQISSQNMSSQMSSACSSMISGTTAPESIPLTRDNSFGGQSDFAMTRLDSTQSYQTDMDHDAYGTSAGADTHKGDEWASYSANLTVSHPRRFSSSATSMASTSRQLLLQGGSVDMQRSVSANSAASTQSNADRRAQAVRKRQIQNAQKASVLLPKPPAALENASSQPTPPKKEAKVAMPKNGGYTRPKHPKAFCTMCNEHPDGFRGEHELKRHSMAKHEGIVKKFICRDPATVGIHSAVTAVNPLSKCKQCVAGKQYGAYYNAAAHLRRTHFKPKSPRGKYKRGDDEEKRGGKGGGDWPSMSELKNWFEEIEVYVNANDGDGNPQDDEDSQLVDTSAMSPNDMAFLGIGESMTYDPDGSTFSMLTELGLDGGTSPGDDGLSFAGNGMALSAVSASYDFSSFNTHTLLGGVPPPEPAFSTISSSNTVTPTSYQDPLPPHFAEDYSISCI